MAFDLKQNPIPIDKTAALVVYQNNEYKDDIVKEDEYLTRDENGGYIFHSYSLPKLIKDHDSVRKNMAGCAHRDYTGFKIGKLTVCGLLDIKHYPFFKKTAGGARWVVRCDCGRYEIRKTKNLRDRKSTKCEKCDKLQYYYIKCNIDKYNINSIPEKDIAITNLLYGNIFRTMGLPDAEKKLIEALRIKLNFFIKFLKENNIKY